MSRVQDPLSDDLRECNTYCQDAEWLLAVIQNKLRQVPQSVMGGGGIHSIVPTYLIPRQIEESTSGTLPNLVGDIDPVAVGPTWGCMLTHDKWQFKCFNAVYALQFRAIRHSLFG